MDVVTEVKEVLREVLQLGERADALNAQSALFGNLPELDSLAAASVIVALEERFGIVVEDDLSADHFETLGSLARFAEKQM